MIFKQINKHFITCGWTAKTNPATLDIYQVRGVSDASPVDDLCVWPDVLPPVHAYIGVNAQRSPERLLMRANRQLIWVINTQGYLVWSSCITSRSGRLTYCSC